MPVANLRRRRRCWQPVSGQEPPPWQLGRLLPADRQPPPIPTSCRTRLALMSLVLGSTYQKVFAKMLQPSANPWILNQIKSIKILDHKDFLFVLKSNITSLHALSPTLWLRLPVLQDNWPFYAALKNAIKTLFCHLGSVSPFMGVGGVEWGPCVCIRGEGRIERKVVVVVQVVSRALVLMRCAYPGLRPPGCALPRSLRPGDICTQRCFASRRAKQKSFRHCSHVLRLFRGFLHDHTSSHSSLSTAPCPC